MNHAMRCKVDSRIELQQNPSSEHLLVPVLYLMQAILVHPH